MVRHYIAFVADFVEAFKAFYPFPIFHDMRYLFYIIYRSPYMVSHTFRKNFTQKKGGPVKALLKTEVIEQRKNGKIVTEK